MQSLVPDRAQNRIRTLLGIIQHQLPMLRAPQCRRPFHLRADIGKIFLTRGEYAHCGDVRITGKRRRKCLPELHLHNRKAVRQGRYELVSRHIRQIVHNHKIRCGSELPVGMVDNTPAIIPDKEIRLAREVLCLRTIAGLHPFHFIKPTVHLFIRIRIGGQKRRKIPFRAIFIFGTRTKCIHKRIFIRRRIPPQLG